MCLELARVDEVVAKPPESGQLWGNGVRRSGDVWLLCVLIIRMREWRAYCLNFALVLVTSFAFREVHVRPFGRPFPFLGPITD
jgi:hypothetical protein